VREDRGAPADDCAQRDGEHEERDRERRSEHRDADHRQQHSGEQRGERLRAAAVEAPPAGGLEAPAARGRKGLRHRGRLLAGEPLAREPHLHGLVVVRLRQ